MIEASAVLADVSGKRDQQNDGAVGEVVVEPVVRPAPWIIIAGLRVPSSVREGLNLVRREAGELRQIFSSGYAAVLLQQFENRSDFGALSIGQLD